MRALGQALQADHQSAAALAMFERANALFPRNVPLAVRYADTLMQTGHARQAHELLLDLFNNIEPTPEQIRLTALAASAAGDTGDAYYYMARIPHQQRRPGARQPAARTGAGLAQSHLRAAPALPRAAR